jgi:hypothetical protein
MLLDSASALIRVVRGSQEVPRTYEVKAHGCPVPAAPRHRGRWGLHVVCVHMHEAPPGRPREARFKAEALFSNIVYIARSCSPGARFWTQFAVLFESSDVCGLLDLGTDAVGPPLQPPALSFLHIRVPAETYKRGNDI